MRIGSSVLHLELWLGVERKCYVLGDKSFARVESVSSLCKAIFTKEINEGSKKVGMVRDHSTLRRVLANRAFENLS